MSEDPKGRQPEPEQEQDVDIDDLEVGEEAAGDVSGGALPLPPSMDSASMA